MRKGGGGGGRGRTECLSLSDSSGAVHSSPSTQGPSCQPGQPDAAPPLGVLTLPLPLGISASNPHCLPAQSPGVSGTTAVLLSPRA